MTALISQGGNTFPHLPPALCFSAAWSCPAVIPPFGHMLLLLLAPNTEVDRQPGAEKAKTQDQKPQGQAGISAGPDLTQSCSL